MKYTMKLMCLYLLPQDFSLLHVAKMPSYYQKYPLEICLDAYNIFHNTAAQM